MRTVTVFVFGDGKVKVIADPALAIIRADEWSRQGLRFWSEEVGYEDDKLRPYQAQVFGPSGIHFVTR